MIERIVDFMTYFEDQDQETAPMAPGSTNDRANRFRRDIGPIGTAIRLILGVFWSVSLPTLKTIAL